MIGGFSYLDAALLAIVAISGLVAMYRGLHARGAVDPLLGRGGRGAASTSSSSPQAEIAEEIAKQFQRRQLLVAQVAIGGVIFLVVLIIVHLITARISDSVLDSRVGAIDRILGLAFGMVRGFVLVVIPYMFCRVLRLQGQAGASSAQGCRPGELPGWVENANPLPLINQTSGTLFSLLSRYAPSVPDGTGEQQQGSFCKIITAASSRPVATRSTCPISLGASRHDCRSRRAAWRSCRTLGSERLAMDVRASTRLEAAASRAAWPTTTTACARNAASSASSATTMPRR